MKKNWKLKKLGDVCDIVNGGTPNTKVKQYWEGNILWITPKDMGKLKEIYVSDTERKITQSGLKNSSAKILPVNSIILSSRAPIGHLAINEKEIATNQGCKGIVPKNGLSSEFLYYFLKKSTAHLNELGSGTTFKELSTTKLSEVLIPYPTLEEQEKTVSNVNSSFRLIDKAKLNVKRNLKNAQELFESYLQSLFENISAEWQEKKLGEVCSIGDGNYSSKYPKASEFVSAGIPFLTATNLKNGTVISDGIRFISKEQHLTLKKGHVKEDDLVIVVRGSSTGNNSLVPKEYEGSNLNSQLAYLRVKGNYLRSDFLFAVFNSPIVIRIVKSAISGAAQPQLPNNKLLDIKISFPNILEQHKIVKKLNILRAETKKLESIYQKKIENFEELKKSILEKAFNGELDTIKSIAV